MRKKTYISIYGFANDPDWKNLTKSLKVYAKSQQRSKVSAIKIILENFLAVNKKINNDTESKS